jgi:Protein of unknown function (Hypoth_ymh)
MTRRYRPDAVWPQGHTRPIPTRAILKRTRQDIAHLFLADAMTPDVRLARFAVDVEPDLHTVDVSPAVCPTPGISGGAQRRPPACRCEAAIVAASHPHDRTHGTSLVMTVFGGAPPQLALNPGMTLSEKNEQEGFKFLFAGAMQGPFRAVSSLHELGHNTSQSPISTATSTGGAAGRARPSVTGSVHTARSPSRARTSTLTSHRSSSRRGWSAR